MITENNTNIENPTYEKAESAPLRPIVKGPTSEIVSLLESLVTQSPFSKFSMPEQNEFIACLIDEVKKRRADQEELLRRQLSQIEQANKSLHEISRR